MNRIFLLFLCLLSASPQADARMTAVIVGAQTPVAASTTDYTADANCQGAWFMNGAYGGDGSEAEADRSGKGNDLTVSTSDTITDSSSVPSGYSGRSRDFTRANSEHLYIADGTELDIYGADAKVTIVTWIYPTSAPASDAIYYIIGKHYPGGNQRQYLLTQYGTGSSQFKFTFYLSDSSASGSAADSVSTTTTTYAINTWYHVVAVYDDTDMRIYVNGYLDCTPVSKTDGIYNSTASFGIGENVAAPGGTSFGGLMSEAAIFDRALSSSEALDIYTNGISGDKGGSD